MKKIILSIVIMVCLTAPFCSVMADTNEDAQYVKTICNKIGPPNLPTEAELNAQQKLALKDCDAKYDYLDNNVDYNTVRQCALMERAEDTEEHLTGTPILIMLYANGQGVKRNIDLATSLTCQITQDNPDEDNVKLIKALQNLKSMPSISTPALQLCDYRGIDLELNLVCQMHDTEIAKVKRDAQLDSMSSHWSTAQQKAFTHLRKSAEDYFATIIQIVYATGAQGNGYYEAVESTNDEYQTDFLNSVTLLEKGQLPHYSAEESQALNLKLNKLYNDWLQGRKDDMQSGNIPLDKKDFQDLEKTRSDYFDAWLKFDTLRYPQISQDSWKGWLATQQIKILKSITDDNN